MRIVWNIFIIIVGLAGLLGGLYWALALRAFPPVCWVLILGGTGLVLTPIFRSLLGKPTPKQRPHVQSMPAHRPGQQHAPYAHYGAFEVKTQAGPRDWRPPTTD